MTNNDDCVCGQGGGMACHPDCPAYVPPPPTEITGSVKISGKTRHRAPDNAVYRSQTFVAANTEPVQLLGKDDQRARALVWATAAVIIGRLHNINNSVGVTPPANTVIELHNQDELWAKPTGVDAIVHVVNERYT